MADKQWLPLLYETCPGGVSSAVAPELLPPGQYAWGFNSAVRGAKPHTRPPFVERLELPAGLHQCSGYFGVQGGMIVTAIAGQLYRLRIGVFDYSYEAIPLPWNNSGILKQNWMQQTIESLVIQDGQSSPIIYNGSTARRAGATEVPRGRQMAYGNGRLWVAVNENEILAGDIRTGMPGSELFFTEATYLVGGGKLFFPRGVSGMDFIPVTGAADFGTLIVGGKDYMDSIRADVTTRDQWGMPGFITTVFRDVGFSGDWSIVQVNQDLYWRDADGGIRSLANNISTNNSPGSTPVSREVGRLVDHDGKRQLPFCSAIYFDNRFLMTSSPYLNVSGGVSWRDIASLDFSPISTMQAKAPPAYDGQWTGIPGVAQLIAGDFNGKKRAFAISSGQDGINRLWEILAEGQGRHDLALSCGSGATSVPIQSFIEYPVFNFGLRVQRKRMEGLQVWLSGMVGELDLVAYWRSDNYQKWTEWDAVAVCAKTTDASTTAPHVWKNLLPQQRVQIKTFTIPDGLDPITLQALQVGFEFQIRLAWRGKCQIDKIVVLGSALDDQNYANRDAITDECVENNVTGNRITYQVPTVICSAPEPPGPPFSEPIFEQYDGPFVGIRFLTQTVTGETRVLYAFDFTGMEHSHAAGGIPLPNGTTTDGIIGSEWAGVSTYDPNTMTYTGAIIANVFEAGAIPGGSNYVIPAGAPYTVTGDTFDEVMASLALSLRFHFAARSYVEFGTAESTFIRRWFSQTPGPALNGWFAGSPLSSIWSDGFTLQVIESNLVTPTQLGIPIARDGVPAQCQNVLTYDPVTFTYTGTKSRVRFDVEIAAGRTKIYADVKYLVTPDNGDPTYFWYDSQEFDVVGGETYNAVIWYPWIVAAEVCFVSADFFYTPVYFLGYGNVVNLGEYLAVPANSNWPEEVVYGMPPRNGEAWDDFEDYGGADTAPSTVLMTLFTGYGWVDAWQILSTDPVDCYDDFEGYVDGAISLLSQGVGFAFVGLTFLISTPDVYDDFESYADGAITVLDVAGDYWVGDGFFI